MVDLFEPCPSCNAGGAGGVVGVVPVWDGGYDGCPRCGGVGFIRRVAQPSPDRAALVERMAEAIEQQFELGYTATAIDFASVALAAVEAAGWGPRPEAVTEVEMHGLKQELLEAVERYQWVGARKDHGWHQAGKVLRAVLTSDVLRSRGITVEGAT